MQNIKKDEMDRRDPYAIYDDEIVLFDQYLEVMEEFLDSEAREHVERIENLRKEVQMPYNGKSSLEKDDDFYLSMLDQFADILRKSFFVNLYAAFESKLVKECQKQWNDKIPRFEEFGSKNQNNIERAKGYFKKVLGVQFPSDTPEWQEIQNYRLVRNCIVHHHGQVREEMKDKNLRKYVTRNNNLSLYGSEISFRKGFCEEAFQTFDKFLRSMFYPK